VEPRGPGPQASPTYKSLPRSHQTLHILLLWLYIPPTLGRLSDEHLLREMSAEIPKAESHKIRRLIINDAVVPLQYISPNRVPYGREGAGGRDYHLSWVDARAAVMAARSSVPLVGIGRRYPETHYH